METKIKNNLSEKYSKGTIVIHWFSFLFILALIPTGFIMTDMEPGTTKLNLLRAHIMMGMLVFVLTLIRTWIFFVRKRPAKLETGSRLHNKLVIWIENSFYFILILLSMTGIATVTIGGLGEAVMNADVSLLPQHLKVPSMVPHKALAIILIVLLLGHIGGVVIHYMKTRENTLKRITPY